MAAWRHAAGMVAACCWHGGGMVAAWWRHGGGMVACAHLKSELLLLPKPKGLGSELPITRLLRKAVIEEEMIITCEAHMMTRHSRGQWAAVG